MSRKMHQWLQWTAMLFITCLMTSGLSTVAEAQNSGTLTIKSIKPVPKLEKPAVIKHYNKQPESGVKSSNSSDHEPKPERLYIDGTGRLKETNLPRRTIVIGNDTWPLSPEVKFYLGDQIYHRMPSDFETGRYVAYRIDSKTDKITDLWLYDDIKALIED